MVASDANVGIYLSTIFEKASPENNTPRIGPVTRRFRDQSSFPVSIAQGLGPTSP
jgi:hypothetical protein